MGFGLSVLLLNFSKTTFRLQNVSIYRDLNTLLLLNKLIIYCLTEKFSFRFENRPTISNINTYLTGMFKMACPSSTHSLYDNFFSHIFLDDEEREYFGALVLLRIENKYYMTPNPRVSYASEVLVKVMEDESLYLFFDKYRIREYMPFWWCMQDEHYWLQSLGKYITEDKKSLILVEWPETKEFLFNDSLYNFYTLLLTSFHTFPFTSEETESKEIIYKYITTMQQFLNVTK